MNEFYDTPMDFMKAVRDASPTQLDVYQSAMISNVTRRSVDFELRTGRRPTTLYLGEAEYLLFKTLNMLSLTEQDLEKNRPKLADLVVYKVDSISYLECS